MPFRSKTQWRWAFATEQPWARRWADETPSFRRLPATKAEADDGSVAADTRGRDKDRIERTFEDGSTKPMAAQTSRQAERIEGNLFRGEGGKFQGGPGTILQNRVQAIRDKRKKQDAPPEEPKPMRADDMKKFLQDVTLDEKNAEALSEFFSGLQGGEELALNRAAAEALQALGFLTINEGQDGSPNAAITLTKAGKDMQKAMMNGDIAKGMALVEKGNERAAKLAEKTKEREARTAEREKAKSDRLTADAIGKKDAAEKPKGGGGGGGGGKKKDDAPVANPAQTAAARRDQRLAQLAMNGEVGLDADEQTRLIRGGFLSLGRNGRLQPGENLNAAIKASASLTPPAAVRAAARSALAVRSQKPPSQRGMTPVGLARARDLANGRAVSLETARRMVAYFDRHAIDKEGATWGERGKGWQAWHGWGGDAGAAWARRIVANAERSEVKHGKHNQASHGRKGGGKKGGGGSSGGGGGSAPISGDQAKAQVDDLKAKYEGRADLKPAIAALDRRAQRMQALEQRIAKNEARLATIRAERAATEQRIRDRQAPSSPAPLGQATRIPLTPDTSVTITPARTPGASPQVAVRQREEMFRLPPPSSVPEARRSPFREAQRMAQQFDSAFRQSLNVLASLLFPSSGSTKIAVQIAADDSAGGVLVDARKANEPTDGALWRRAIAEAKKRFAVYPSAYANAWAAKWYKRRGGRWSAGSTKDLREWFAEEWVDISRPLPGGGFAPCGRPDGSSRRRFPKCLPKAKAMRLTEAERQRLINRKRRTGLPEDGAPVMVSNEIKHGKHNQASHGRKTGRRRAYAAAYKQARANGASVGEARLAAKEAGIARLAERDQRLARLRERAKTQGLAPTVVQSGKRDGDTTKAYGNNPNKQYELQHRLVDMGDVKASNLANGGVNPDYNPALQPRDRSRMASQQQIDQVARTMNADVLTTDFHRIDSGSPIIDADGNVLSGNGRTLALQRAADLYPAQYAAYKDAIKKQAIELGIDPREVDRMQNTVLVRQLRGDDDPIAFAREANTSGTLRMSPLEQAKVDADLLSDRSMLRLNVAEGQDIDRALRDPSNRPFVQDFLRTVPENERANLLTRSGDLNQMGLYRMKAAVYTRAFKGEAGERLAESMLESLDPSVKNIQNGISGGLPSVSRATSLIRSGERDGALDISNDFAKVVDVYARVKDNPAFTENTPANRVIEKYLNQGSLFDRELDPVQERLLQHVDSIARRPTAVRDFLNRWADTVERQPPPGQSSLFGDSGGFTREQLIDYLISSGGD